MRAVSSSLLVRIFAFILAPRRLSDSPRVACSLTSSAPLPASQMRAVPSSPLVRILFHPGSTSPEDRIRLAGECDQLGAAGDIPDAGRAVVAAGEDFVSSRLHVA